MVARRDFAKSMQKILYTEAGPNGTQYKKGEWKELWNTWFYAHDEYNF